MSDSISAGIEQHFGDIEDPRIDRTKLHKLMDILVIAICAVIAGADRCEGLFYQIHTLSKSTQQHKQTYLHQWNLVI
jgi:hypothetical protein